MDASYTRVLLHTEVRWLSKGKTLLRIYQLREELLVFFREDKQEIFCNHLQFKLWINKLAYLTDIFESLNNLNISMQGRSENILSSTDKLAAFEKKIRLWKDRANSGNFSMFPSVQTSSNEEMKSIIVHHLSNLEQK